MRDLRAVCGKHGMRFPHWRSCDHFLLSRGKVLQTDIETDIVAIGSEGKEFAITGYIRVKFSRCTLRHSDHWSREFSGVSFERQTPNIIVVVDTGKRDSFSRHGWRNRNARSRCECLGLLCNLSAW